MTIFGESAGGFAVTSLLATPAAKGLFHRAIPQSGAAHTLGFNPEAGRKVHDRLMEKLGVEKGDIKALRMVPAQEIIKAQVAISEQNQGEFGTGRPLSLGPVTDKSVMPLHPLEAVRDGYAKKSRFKNGGETPPAKVSDH